MTQQNDAETPGADRPGGGDAWKDRLAYWGVVAAALFIVLLFLLMTFEASVINFDCFLTDFLQGKCARWGRWW